MILVAYFSYSGNARKLAERIADVKGSDLFEIEPQEKYSDIYKECVERAKEECMQDIRPTLCHGVTDMEKYDKVVICFPNWCGTCPMPVLSFVAENDMAGKKIYPFVTNGGGGCGKGAADIRRCAGAGEVLEAKNGNTVTDDIIAEI